MINILCIIGIFTATFFGGLSLILVSLLKNEKDRCKKLKRENRELEKLSITDPLTGAFTRRLLETIFPSELSRAKRTGMPLVPLMVDIDRFTTINTREDKRNIEEIIEDADNALYKAKHTGRNKVVCLD